MIQFENERRYGYAQSLDFTDVGMVAGGVGRWRGGGGGCLPTARRNIIVTQNTYIPTPMPFSCIFLLNTVSILPCVNEYSNINASKMNATNILKIKEKEFFFFN